MLARRLLRSVFRRVADGNPTTIKVIFADGSTYENRPGEAAPDLRITFRSRAAERHSVVFFYHGLFEKYVEGEIDIEGAASRPLRTFAEFGWRAGVGGTKPGSRFRNPLMAIRERRQEREQSNADRKRAIRNADFHYALHPRLFERMLGRTVGYSEGIWAEDTRTLDQAKYNNYEYVARKLRLEPGMEVLEVGGGWGYLAIHLAKRYGVRVTEMNPVRRQNDYMRERFARHGLADRITLIEGDHRDIAKAAGRFDRFVSIGVHEHAGYEPAQYRLWADAIAAALKDGGLGVISTTSIPVHERTNFLTLKYIFPGGHLPSLPLTLATFSECGLMPVSVENLWPHYQRTVVCWAENFARHWPEIQAADPETFTESFRRRWTMYLEGTSGVFGFALDLSHIVFAKGRAAAHFPWAPGQPLGFEPMVGDTEPECYP